jgi:GNAT superfamily N-acetyltransferase
VLAQVPSLEPASAPFFELRPCGEPEMAELVGLYRHCTDFLLLTGDKPVDEAMVRADLALSRREGGLFLGIRLADGTLAGVADAALHGYEERRDLAFLILLMIGRPWRRLGLGRAVVIAVESLAWSDPAIRVMQTAVQVDNPSGAAFWEAAGYRRLGGPELQPDGTVTYLLEKERPLYAGP